MNESFVATARSTASKARLAFRSLRSSPSVARNAVLLALANRLTDSAVIERILAANAQDLEAARSGGLKDSLIDRLKLDAKRMHDMASAVREIASFPDPVGEVVQGRTLASGIRMIQKRVPLGVVFTIFESRPNVTVDIGALCVKSGNAAILRGGKEAIQTNLALHGIFRDALSQAGLPADSVQMVEDTDRSLMQAFLQQADLIDLVVPRGGDALIQFVTEHSRIPVVKHDRGVCNLYVDRNADNDLVLRIAANAKLQRPSVCNAIENLIIHREYPFAKKLLMGLSQEGAILRGDDESVALFPEMERIENPDQEYALEYLDNRLAVKIVGSLEEAVEFIYRYGSAHSEAILSRDEEAINRFVASVDSAAVFVNCSTRFHDGGQMGMGAEVGISTGRLHVRGPMGVQHLTTTTYIMEGEGQVRI
ncbi:MAG: glutamate-5-semialdehyde dehydrogenase [Spirochaetia bacterium]|nr:glutamate-5-semialdehyde dehydrogenase [Spirochaetia bacterium]